jgi:hypothetical protein
VAQDGVIWEHVGVILDNFGVVWDKLGVVLDNVGNAFSSINRMNALKNAHSPEKHA